MMQEIVEEIDAYTNELIIKLTELEAYYEVLKQDNGDYRKINYIIEELQAIKHQLDVFRRMVSGGDGENGN